MFGVDHWASRTVLWLNPSSQWNEIGKQNNFFQLFPSPFFHKQWALLHIFCYIPWYSYLCPTWNGGKFQQVRRSFHLSSPKHESSCHYDPWHQNNLHRVEKVRWLQLVAKMNVCVWVWGGRAKTNLTTSTQTVADLLISVKMFFEKTLDLLLIIRQFLWANFNQVLKKRSYLV